MPAAAWAARSGDPVLFTGRNQVPSATLAALRRHAAATVYVLGPESVISKDVIQQVGRVSASVQRVGRHRRRPERAASSRATRMGPSAGTSTTPGHGMELANADRPLDAAAAASLASSGKWGPLLLTDTADALPPELRSFLLDIKPGYETDPDPSGVQPHLADGRRDRDRRTGSGGGGRAGGAGPDRRAPREPREPPGRGGAARRGRERAEPDTPEGEEEMSEAERPDRLTRPVTVEDIRALAGPSTPHFALQVRNRIQKLIERSAGGRPRAAGGRDPDRPARGARAAQRRPARRHWGGVTDEGARRRRLAHQVPAGPALGGQCLSRRRRPDRRRVQAVDRPDPEAARRTRGERPTRSPTPTPTTRVRAATSAISSAFPSGAPSWTCPPPRIPR